MYFAELRTFPGPQAIGAIGDNSFDALYGREWAVLFCDDDTFHTLQWTGVGDAPPEGLTSGGWHVIPDPLLTLPPLTAGVERSISAAFDQNARLIVAYEKNGVVEVTRWEPSEGVYKQNVSFAGRDPQLLIDAALADPRGYPTIPDDGWSVREAFDAGVRVWFEWLPDGVYRTTAIPDSDVLLFYLSLDRTVLHARVQREIYAIERTIYDFGEPVTLDHAVALSGRYQLLVSDAVGVRLPEALVSDPYLGDLIINPRHADPLTGVVAPEGMRAETWLVNFYPTDDLSGDVLPEMVTVSAGVYPVIDSNDLVGGVAPELVTATAQSFAVTDSDTLASGVTPADPLTVVRTTALTVASDALDGAVALEAIRVKPA